MDSPIYENKMQSQNPLIDALKPATGREGLDNWDPRGAADAPVIDPWSGSPDEGLMVPSQKPNLYEQLDPHHIYMFDQVANQGSKLSTVEEAGNNAMMGQTIDQQVETKKTQDAVTQSSNIAQATAHLSDEQFNQVMEHIKQRMTPTPLPTAAPLNSPNLAQSAFALVAAMMDPRHAAQIGSQPFNYQLSEQAKQDQTNQANYQLQEHQRQSDLQTLGKQADDITARDRTNAEFVNDAANRATTMRGQDITREGQKESTARTLLDNLSTDSPSKIQGAVAGLEQMGIHLPADVVKNLMAEAQKGIDDKNKAKKHIADEASITKYILGAAKSATAEGARTNALTAIAMMDPTDERRINLEAELPALSKQTAAELYKNASTALANERANDLKLTRADRIAGMIANAKYKDAATELAKANKDLSGVRAELVHKKVKWYDVTSQATLDDLQMHTAKLQREANDAANGALNGKGITPTAYENAHRLLADSVNKTNASQAMLEAEAATFAAHLKTETDPKIKAEVQKALDANQAGQAFNKSYGPKQQQQLTELETKYTAQQQAAKASAAQSQQQSQQRTSHTADLGPINDLKSKAQQAFPGEEIQQFGPGSIANSLHHEGKALDLMGGDMKSKAAWAINQPGVKTVIYNGQIWNPGKGWHAYTGPDPHTTHVHVDMGSGAVAKRKGGLKLAPGVVLEGG